MLTNIVIHDSLLILASESQLVRPLGGFERLLGRKSPTSDTLSISHSAAFIVDNQIDWNILVQAAQICMKK